MASLDAIAPLSCKACPRLSAFLDEQRQAHPDWHNAPVPSFGPRTAQLLIVGLAPGLRGANRTGRPFTGDFAGDTLYQTLLSTGLARGQYQQDGQDDLELPNVRITNAVRCVPPQNKPTAQEVHKCRPYLETELSLMPNLAIILSLGKISHDSVLRHFGLTLSHYPFAHQAVHQLPSGLMLVDSYHCSRYNTQTGRLTPAMFAAVFAEIQRLLSS